MEKYVVSELIGQLGNQLFNWATGLAVSRRNNWTHYIDESEIQIWGNYLNEFGIHSSTKIPKSDDRFLSRLNKSNNKLLKKTSFESQKILEFLQISKVFREKHYHYDASIREIRPNMRLKGYFQSWKYFEEFMPDIRELLINNRKILDSTQEVINSLGFKKWIGIHVRRGDYLKFKSYHGLTTKEYFNNSLNLVYEFVGQIPIVVFSDSPDLARLVVPSANIYIGPSHTMSPAQNMIFMSMSEAFIGSNSTYSWWAAFQKEHQQNIVFPRPWFINNDINAKDLLPPKWISLGTGS
jgi:hypothetical protein